MASRHDPAVALRLVAPSARVRMMFFMLSVLLPTLVTGLVMTLSAMLPGASTPQLLFDSEALTIAVPLLAVLVVGLLIWAVFDRLMRRAEASLRGDRFELAVAWFRRSYALSELRLDQARVVDLDERTELRPRFKRRAIRSPGYRSGTFRLRSGASAFVATGPGTRVLFLPTTRPEALLLEFEQPQAALDALRSAADRPGNAR